VRILAIFGVVALFAGPALANPFDDCVLEGMKGVTSDLAAKSIKVACLRKSSVEIPADSLTKLVGTANYGDFGRGTGFVMHIDNQLEYVITEITIRLKIGKEADKLVRNEEFYELPARGVVVTGLPPDPTTGMMIKPFTQCDYWIPMQTSIDLNTKRANWFQFRWVP